MTVTELENLLYRECGRKGLSGISNDVRALETAIRAPPLCYYFVLSARPARRNDGGCHGGIDAFVFTAGIGENSVKLCARITERLAWVGAVLDPAANAADRQQISSRDSPIGLYVTPTDEELMIARDTLDVLRKGHDT